MDEETPLPMSKRKKVFSRSEIIDKLKENDQKVIKVAEEISEELSPFDVDDEDAVLVEDRLERLVNTTKTLTKKIYKIQKEFKERKYRHNPDKLNEKVISSSQYSIFESEDSESL